MARNELWQLLWETTTDVVVVLDREGRILHANPALETVFGYAPGEAIGKGIDLLQPERLREGHRIGFERHLATGERRLDWRSVETRGLHKSGRELPVEVSFSRLDVDGEPLFAGFMRDITERRRAQKRLAAQTRVLELLAAGKPLEEVLGKVVELMEADFRDMLCSVLLLDESGKRLHTAAAPSLPAEYSRAIDGEPIGPAAGSCGTAAWRNALVAVSDIATDPLWEGYREIALRHGLRACWSVPIAAASGAVLGTLALYYREPRAPTLLELEVIGVAASFAGIAIERARADARMREAVERFQLASRATNDAIWDWSFGPGTVWWSEGYRTLFGHELGETALGVESWTDYIHPEDKPRILASVHEVIGGTGTAWQGEYRFRRADGSYAAVFDRGLVSRDASGKAVRMIGAMIDISARKDAEERLAHLAQFDTLTGLPNRALFRDRLSQAVSRAHREGWRSALAFIDLDRFKEINDSLGHAAGDEVLKAAAERLRGCLREGDTVARLGGDEFTAILEDLKSAEDLALVAQKMMAALAQPLRAHGHELAVTASIGAAVYPADGADAESLLKRADTAMYHAKRDGGNSFQAYAATMGSAASERARLEAGLRQALERGELALHYQPLVRVAGQALVGAEALLRWNHPERGLVLPAEFIPVAEASGLILPIGEWVVREVCAQAARWDLQGRGLRIGINLSARQFRRRGLVEMVTAELARAAVPASVLTLEITESLLMESPEGSRDLLERLKLLGVKVSLDDFGTGYSSLAYLRHFPLDSVKIDRSFVRDVNDDPEDATIVKAVITLAHELRLRVVAEGVETQAQLDFLAAHGCDMVQGYLIGRPEPAAVFARRLAAR